MRDKNSFRQRYKYWKETGELPYSGGLKRDLSNQALSEEAPVKSGILPGYDGGRDGMFIKYVDSYRVNPETGGVYDKVGDIKEGAVILPEVEVTARKPEFMRMLDEMNRMRSIQSRQGLSGSDPLGQFVVEGVALNPVFKALGTAGLYTLGRYGESLTGFAKPLNWARAKLLTREMDNPIIKTLTPTERIFAALQKPVPKTPYSGNLLGARLMKQSPTIQNLKSLGVDVELLSPEDLKQLLKLRRESIQDPHLMGRRATVDSDLSSVNVFDGELDANGDFWPIGNATFDRKPISGQNAFASVISDGPDKIPHSEFLDDNLRGIHMIQNYSTYPELKGVVSPRKHVAQDIYNVAIDYLRSSGKGIGLLSGKELLTPQATIRTITPKNYRMVTFPNTGVWRYGNKMQIGDSWMLLLPKTKTIPYKNVELFNANNIDNLGNFGIDWTRGSAY